MQLSIFISLLLSFENHFTCLLWHKLSEKVCVIFHHKIHLFEENRLTLRLSYHKSLDISLKLTFKHLPYFPMSEWSVIVEFVEETNTASSGYNPRQFCNCQNALSDLGWGLVH